MAALMLGRWSTPFALSETGGYVLPAVQVPVVDNGLKVVPVGEAVNPSHQTKVNWIFEYPKNAEYDFCGETKNTLANRVIVATRPAV